MTTFDRDSFISACRAANEAARKAIRDMRDGGTCCFDHPVVWPPDGTHRSVIIGALTEAGLLVRPTFGKLQKDGISVSGCPGSRAQGWPRTTGAEAWASTMTATGYRTSVFYMMD